MKIVHSITLIFSLSLLLAACGGEPTPAERAAAARDNGTPTVMPDHLPAAKTKEFTSPLEGTTWRIGSLKAGDTSHDFTQEKPATISFRKGLMRGSLLCNDFSVSYEVPVEKTLALDKFSTSQQPCTGQNRVVEQQFFDTVKAVDGYEMINANLLVLKSGSATITLFKQ